MSRAKMPSGRHTTYAKATPNNNNNNNLKQLKSTHHNLLYADNAIYMCECGGAHYIYFVICI